MLLIGLVLLGGIVLRVWLTAAWRPALTGYHDEPEYLLAASGDLFADTMRTMGYPVFLRVVHAVWPHLTLVVLVQHLLGLASALLLYGSVRRVTGSRWPGLLPLAIVCLAGAEVFVEHAIITEALFVFLQAAVVYALVRRLDSGSIAWPLLAGALAGAATTVRVLGLYLVPLALVAVAVAPRRRLAAGGVCAAGAAVVLLAYMLAAHGGNGHFGLTRAGAWNNYGRVAPFADCSKFTPPKGTDVLCESTPKSARPGPQTYVFEQPSPAVRAFGHPYGPGQGHTSQVSAFARAVVLDQPGDFISAVWRDLRRYYEDDVPRPPGYGFNYRDFGTVALFAKAGLPLRPYWATGPFISADEGAAGALKRWYMRTLVRGPLWALLMVLTLVAPFAAPRGRPRYGAALLTVVTLCATVLPVAGLMWDARFAIPSFGVLAASAAVGGWAIGRRLSPRLSRLRSARTAREPA